MLTGEFGLDDQKRVKNPLSEVFTDNVQGIVFDLTAVTYMEEAGFETLMFYLQELIEFGACIQLLKTRPGTSGAKARILDLSYIADIITVPGSIQPTSLPHPSSNNVPSGRQTSR